MHRRQLRCERVLANDGNALMMLWAEAGARGVVAGGGGEPRSGGACSQSDPSSRGSQLCCERVFAHAGGAWMMLRAVS